MGRGWGVGYGRVFYEKKKRGKMNLLTFFFVEGKKAKKEKKKKSKTEWFVA